MGTSTLLIKDARIIDPFQDIDYKSDILIKNGEIVEISSNIETEDVADIVKENNIIVTPSLVDMHTHVYPDETPLGVWPDMVGINMGVSVLVDAGSAGALTFDKFKENVILKSCTKVYEFLNVAQYGLKDGTGELSNIDNINIECNKKIIEKNKEIIKGIKARASASVVGNLGLEPIKIAKRFADDMNLPLMVHIGNTPPLLHEVMNLLTKGDIVTHIYHGKKGGLFNSDGTVLKEAVTAYERGVLFDVGHGTSSFNFNVAKKAFDIGIKPYTAGTDIYNQNINGPVYSLLITLTKLVNLGLSLKESIALVTVNPKRVLGLDNKPIKTGYKAEMSIIQMVEGLYPLVDSEGSTITSTFKFVPKYLFMDGKLIKAKGE